jgi:hypothetical protein
MSDVVLRYVGGETGNHLVNYPARDIEDDELAQMAAQDGRSVDEQKDWLLSWRGVWALPDDEESATIPAAPDAEAAAEGAETPARARKR